MKKEQRRESQQRVQNNASALHIARKRATSGNEVKPLDGEMRKQVYETMHKLYANKSDTTMGDTIMNIPSKNKPYFSFPAFDISCFWPEDTGLAHKVKVYVPFETTMRFSPFVGIIVNRKQYAFFSISDSPQIKPLCRALLSETDICQTMQWIRLNREALLRHWRQEISTYGLCLSLRKLNGGETRFQRIR